jgi:gamma-glutamylcyclotransferase (GGCT)/AIG2-like uncharacterized protein YtfP
MTEAPRVVVFYGTLMHDQPPLSEQPPLADHVRYLRPCRIRGELWDYGPWPGFVPGEGIVTGELWELVSEDAIHLLDAWEEYDPGDEAGSRYVRRVVTTFGEPACDAWVYVWNSSLCGLRRIPGGDWRARSPER